MFLPKLDGPVVDLPLQVQQPVGSVGHVPGGGIVVKSLFVVLAVFRVHAFVVVLVQGRVLKVAQLAESLGRTRSVSRRFQRTGMAVGVPLSAHQKRLTLLKVRFGVQIVALLPQHQPPGIGGVLGGLLIVSQLFEGLRRFFIFAGGKNIQRPAVGLGMVGRAAGQQDKHEPQQQKSFPSLHGRSSLLRQSPCSL